MSKHWNPPVNKGRSDISEKFDALSTETKLIKTHLQLREETADPVGVPIYQTSIYRHRSVRHYLDILNEGGYIYQRLGNPTTEAAEILVNELEGGVGSLLFSSGLAAMNAVFLTFLKCGDHIVCQNPCYSGAYQFVTKTLHKFGVEISWVRAGAPVIEYEKLIKPNTRMLYGETPCNPNMTILDLKGFGELGKKHTNLLTVVDGTFASPFLQQPLKMGVDISLHSCSKYLGGHTDLIGGCVTVTDVQLWKELKTHMASSGACLAPFDSYLLYRGLKTLPLRMEKHCENAMQIARFLESHPKVCKVWYPGLQSHPGHEAAKHQMHGFGGMISFEMRTLDEARRVVENLKIITLAVSLGGPESLIEHPATMTHGDMLMSDSDRLEAGITDGLVRFSVGLENARDLIEDLTNSLNIC